MKRIISLFFVPLILGFMLVSCNNSNKKPVAGDKENKASGAKVTVPVFNEDSAYNYVKAQTDFGPRVNNTAAHEKCAAWLEQKLKSYTKDVTIQKAKVRAYNGTSLNMKNIIASFNPDAPGRIMLCSHWDSRPYADWDEDKSKNRTPIDGANDGASGVGVLIEIARIISQNKINMGLDIIFFDAEDYGEPQDDNKKYNEDNWGLGSQYWAKNPHVPNYKAHYGILLDMVGVENANYTKEGFSMEYAPDVMNKVWDAAARIGYGGNFSNAQTNPITDDHYYVNKISGIPTIDIIHYDSQTSSGFYKNWHTTNDNIENVDKRSLKAVGQTLLTVIYEESGTISQK
ncbi:MAG TPA: M28 family peptidase [Bacteroidales bacterium]|nr:M28 family peptidase [Bacteroidales bacterium]